MSARESTAVTVARSHVEAWDRHDFDAARDSLARDVHVVTTTVDPTAPKTDLTGVDPYMEGLVQFAEGVLSGTTEVTSAVGDDSRALLQVASRVKFGPDAPEMTLHGARLYLLDDSQKIKDERVIFLVRPG